ncbi:hypothetical protein ScPMuIL_003737 [Solemya velum]
MAPSGDGKAMLSTKKKHPKKDVCIETDCSCNRLSLFVFTVIYLIVGLSLLVIGVWVEIYRRDYEILNNELALPVALLIFVGLFIAINSVCGIVGTISKTCVFLKIFLAVTVVAFFVQLAIGTIAYIHRQEIPNILSSQLMFAVKGYTQNSEIRQSMDALQINFKCCGFVSYSDYEENEIYSCESETSQKCGVPYSCCKPQGDVNPSVTCGYGVRWNSTIPERKIYLNGCTDEFVDWVYKNLDIVGATALGFALPQILGILLVYYFIRKVEDSLVLYRVAAS